MREQKSTHKLPTKVLIVDDSAFMRRVIISILEKDKEIKVVGYARDGEDALQKINRLKPDVITLDVEMPKMDGIETLKQIMCNNPLPVVMLSAHTLEGAESTIKALEIGAVDFIAKPGGINKIQSLSEELPEKLKTAARVKVQQKCVKASQSQVKKIVEPAVTATHKIDVVAIGTSTGGPSALQKVLSPLPKEFPLGVIVVQHMPPGFTGPLANRLNEICSVFVKEAEQGDRVEAGKVLIAPAGWQMHFERKGSDVFVRLGKDAPFKTIFKPSVDVMLYSLAEVYGGNCLGVVLTGMGDDGTRGLKHLKSLGATVLAQNEETCVVYGMPKRAVEAGVVDKIISLEQIGTEIVNIVMKRHLKT